MMETIRPFDVAEFLHDHKTAAMYLAAVTEDGNPDQIAGAVADIQRVKPARAESPTKPSQ